MEYESIRLLLVRAVRCGIVEGGECSVRETTSRNAAVKGDILTAAITAE